MVGDNEENVNNRKLVFFWFYSCKNCIHFRWIWSKNNVYCYGYSGIYWNTDLFCPIQLKFGEQIHDNMTYKKKFKFTVISQIKDDHEFQRQRQKTASLSM